MHFQFPNIIFSLPMPLYRSPYSHTSQPNLFNHRSHVRRLNFAHGEIFGIRKISNFSSVSSGRRRARKSSAELVADLWGTDGTLQHVLAVEKLVRSERPASSVRRFSCAGERPPGCRRRRTREPTGQRRSPPGQHR